MIQKDMITSQLESVAGSVIQATGRLEFEDDWRSDHDQWPGLQAEVVRLPGQSHGVD